MVKRTITVISNIAIETFDANNKNVIFKNCTPFTLFISKINNTKKDNAKDLNIPVLINVDFLVCY